MTAFLLPDAISTELPAFTDKTSARVWLAEQPQAQAGRMVEIIAQQVAALDASTIPGPNRLKLLEFLRGAIFPAVQAVSARFARKPVPLSSDDEAAFRQVSGLWRNLAVAYLRLAPLVPKDEMVLPMHRAVTALRLEQYAHYLAAHALPGEVPLLLYQILTRAEAAGVLRHPVSDAQQSFLGETDIASDIAWAFLLVAVDPYHLSQAQLTVINRAFSRWRGLAGFQSVPDSDRRAKELSLATVIGSENLWDGGMAYLDVRPVSRKVRKRIESLLAGASPEELKLGRELSTTACLRLLRDVDGYLRGEPLAPPPNREGATLTFGLEHIYAAVSGQALHPERGKSSKAVDHQRMALFGFDTLSTPPHLVERPKFPTEQWSARDGKLHRPGRGGQRLLAPALVASQGGAGKASLGVLSRLCVAADGGLQGSLQIFPGTVSCGLLPVPQPNVKIPLFLILDGDALSVVLPASVQVRAGAEISASQVQGHRIRLLEILERGADFVRFSAQEC